jgi:hypothetical protein
VPEIKEKSEALAKAHWGYVESVLLTHGLNSLFVKDIGFHYQTAFIHGYKHGVQDTEEGYE